MANTEGIWQCYYQLDDELDVPIRKALTAIEQIEGLPENFEIWDIKSKEGVGIRMAYRNAGSCHKQVTSILRKLEDETWHLA